MAWILEKIERDWIGGSIRGLALPGDAAVAAFERVQEVLGLEWIEGYRVSIGEAKGLAPTLRIASMGQKLAALEGVEGPVERLIQCLRGGDLSAEAELTALYLLRSRCPAPQAVLYPKVGEGEADFRVRQGQVEDWTYVEVAQPDVSEAQNQASGVMGRLVDLLRLVKKPFALEVFLRREPSEDEVAFLSQRVPEFCAMDGVHREDLPGGLGLLLLNHAQPGQVTPQDHPGEEKRPRIAMAHAIRGPDEPHRHIAVRLAFADERPEEFLHREAKQLPTDSPGLIMLQVSRAPGAMRSWEPRFMRRFQQGFHTRVSAVCLFSSGLLPTPKGEAWLPETKVIINSHARFTLPSWIVEVLTEAGTEFERLVGRPG